jgi:hypothetical protein
MGAIVSNAICISCFNRPSDLEVVLRSLLREHDAEGNDSSLKHDMQMAFETIAPIQSAWLEQASNLRRTNDLSDADGVGCQRRYEAMYDFDPETADFLDRSLSIRKRNDIGWSTYR